MNTKIIISRIFFMVSGHGYEILFLLDRDRFYHQEYLSSRISLWEGLAQNPVLGMSAIWNSHIRDHWSLNCSVKGWKVGVSGWYNLNLSLLRKATTLVLSHFHVIILVDAQTTYLRITWGALKHSKWRFRGGTTDYLK